jgi:hypothetical protein
MTARTVAHRHDVLIACCNVMRVWESKVGSCYSPMIVADMAAVMSDAVGHPAAVWRIWLSEHALEMRLQLSCRYCPGSQGQLTMHRMDQPCSSQSTNGIQHLGCQQRSSHMDGQLYSL